MDIEELKERASERGIEIYELTHPATCTLGHWERENWQFVYCGLPAVANYARLIPEGAGRWQCENVCDKHAKRF